MISEWTSIRKKLEHLRQLDKQVLVSAAYRHDYQFHPPLEEAEVDRLGAQLGCKIPEELRYVYTKLGDGGPGPYYGLLPGRDWVEFAPETPYPGIEAIMQKVNEEQNGYLQGDELTGAIGLIHHGCGEYYCMVVNGSKAGALLIASCDGFVQEIDETLVDVYDDWLDREIGAFELTGRLMSESLTLDEIQGQLDAVGCGSTPAGDYIASIADRPRPEEIFGNPRKGLLKFGGQSDKWHKQVLEEWRQQTR